MRHGTFAAMGTGIEVWCSTERGFHRVVRHFEKVEQICSRFRPDSELSTVNRDERELVPMSPLLTTILVRAQEMRSLTDGLVDAGTGAQLLAWGYDTSFENVAGLEREPAILPVTDWAIQSGSLWREPGVILDLGGIAKGWTCDIAVESGNALVVSAGGDLRSTHPETVVPVVDPWGNRVATLAVGEGALATSSTTRRTWTVGDETAHHIIDPRTGRPADSPILSATVVTETAVEAEAGAKALLLHGADGLNWAESQSWIRSALAIWHDGSVYATSGVEMAA